MINRNLPYGLSLRIDANPSLPGLETFLKASECLFYATAGAQSYTTLTGTDHLVLTLRCNLNLLDVLYHYRQNTWGVAAGTLPENKGQALLSLVKDLEDQNNHPVEIEELNLELNDTLIVIRSIGPNSIALQLGNILNALAEHYVHVTRGLQQMPYEIYLPVTEACENPAADGLAEDYFTFWALYFEGENSARIYELENRRLLAGDLFYEGQGN